MPRPLSTTVTESSIVDGDVDFGAVARQSFVYRVIDDFIDQMVQARFARGADIHGGPLANCFQPFQNFDASES